MRLFSVRFAVVMLALAGVVLVAGCAKDKLTHDNFMLVRQDVSTQADVSDLIGEPQERIDNRWLYERHKKGLIVLVEFDRQGKVERKQWINADTAEWYDSSER